MIKNVSESIMLLMLVSFLASCTALQPARGSKKTTRSTSRTTTKKKNLSESSLRRQIAKTAEKYKGVKYKYAGKTPKGFDCSGFTSYVYDKHDILVSPSSRAQAKIGKKISTRKAQAGDLAFFGSRGKITHVALVVSNSRDGLVVAHSTSSKGVMIQNISKSSYWKPKLLFTRDIISP
ncbi:MAG: C40 family peptidase [Saprospiraceae bacterium]